MSDNLSISTGSGTTIATDQVGTAHYQKVKLVVGASDTANLVVFGQTAMTASLPVVVANDQSTLNVSVVAFTPGGTQNVSIINTPTITVSTALALIVGNVTTGTLSISAGNIAVSNTPTVTVSTGTITVSGTSNVSVVNSSLVVTGTNFTIATLPVISGTGLLLGATTAIAGAFVQTSHASSWNAYAVATTAVATILKTSGAHTLHITDLLFSVDVPMNIDVRSATTVKATVYLATKGGFVFPLQTPFICNSAESLTFLPSASGSCAGYAGGWTVT